MAATDRAEQLARLLPLSSLEPAASAWADESALRKEVWLAAVSGGADSVLLLLLLCGHWPGQRERLQVLHFNHRLRGSASDEDAEFCAALARELGLRFQLGVWDPPSAHPSEDEAREARHGFFETCGVGAGAGVLFTGHQREDVLETQLMRLARGASAAGLSAPRPVRAWAGQGAVVRPLLGLGRTRIRELLQSVGQTWREDSTNATATFFRNRIRHSVLPAWLQAAGGEKALEGAALTRRWLEEDDRALEEWLDELGVRPGTEELELRRLDGKPRALWRRALWRWLGNRELSRAGFDDLLQRCQKGVPTRVSVGGSVAEIEGGSLRWAPAALPVSPWAGRFSVGEGVRVILPDGAEVAAREVPITPEIWQRVAKRTIDPGREAWLSPFGGEGLIRTWRPGDRYRPLGAPGEAKLQDLFTNRKVPGDVRHRIPVICGSEGRILWVPGFGPAEGLKLTDVSVTAVQLTYTPGTSTVPKQSHLPINV